MFDDIIQRRPKKCYDDECCIAPGELDEDCDNENTRYHLHQQNRLNLPLHEPKSKRISFLEEDNSSSALINRKHSGDDEGTLSIQEMKPKTKSQNPSIVRTKENNLSIFPIFFLRHLLK
jgi:hypothetical protein